MQMCAQQLLTIPALQRVSKRLCVVCASPAELYCARCELTPYCGQPCQRIDWVARHSAVCHNLMRSSKPEKTSEDIEISEPAIQPATPLRKPHTTAAQGNERDNAPSANQKFMTPNHTSEQRPPQHNNRGPRNNGYNNNNNNNKNRQEKKTANNFKRNEIHNDSDSQSNHYPKPSTSQSSKEEHIKQARNTSRQPQPAPVNKEPAVPQTETAPRLKTTPVLPETVQTVRQSEPVKSVTPEPELVPDNWLLESLSLGDMVMLSVDARAEDCGTKQPGFVCLSINEGSEGMFQRLCGQFGEFCGAAERVSSVAPGESFAYFDPTDEAWYRARRLSPSSAALVDSCKLVTLVNEDKYTPLTGEYAEMPEFCCVLRAAGVTLGNSLTATLASKTSSGFKVSLANAETGASIGEGEVSRWLPDVEYPKAKTAVSAIPEVSRPDVTNNSTVLLVEANAVDRVLVRPADKEAMRRFDSLLEDVVMYGMNAKPLTEPPVKGQTVIGVYTDGLYYRALCRRTNVKQNKYLLEYIEFGNHEVTQLEKLYPCPPELTLSSQPTQVSLVKLQTDVTALTAAAQYLEKIRDDNQELVLTIPSGESTAPTGAEVCLTIAKNTESINRKVAELCTPQWKKLAEKGGDVINSEVMMNDHLQYLELPEGGCELDVLDVSALACGTVSACERGIEHAQYVLGPLTDRMAEYCDSELCKQPYLPTHMEVCIAKCPPYPQWFRAVLVDHKPGELEAKVCYVDYGNIESVPVSQLRKMLPEFVRDVPALALHVEIKDFPEMPTPQQLGRAVAHMQLTDEGRGTMRVARCERRVHGVYEVDAPELLAAIRG